MLTYYQDLLEDSGETTIPALRCAICGEIIDPVILANRRQPTPNLLYGTKQRKFGRQIVPIDALRNNLAEPAEEDDGSEE